MLGFILSKLNLLILVVSVFAIVSFLSFSLINIVKINEARLLLDRISQQAFSVVSSPSYCFSDSFDVPSTIRVAGTDYYYVVKISVQKIRKDDIATSDVEPDISVVIFSLYPRLDYLRYIKGEVPQEPPSVAASSFRTTAQVHLYSKTYEGSSYSDLGPTLPSGEVSSIAKADDAQGIVIDPQTTVPHRAIEFLKEKRSGATEALEYIYIFSCNNAECQRLKSQASSLACVEFTSTHGFDQSKCADIRAADGDVWFNC